MGLNLIVKVLDPLYGATETIYFWLRKGFKEAIEVLTYKEARVYDKIS